MSAHFKLLMISAMYENGGNTTQRLLDGHPELFSYPFESQTGTKYVQDYLSSLYPFKYRWPVFTLHGTAAEDYEAIIDEECKVRLKTPQSSKFRDFPLQLDDTERKRLFIQHMQAKARSRANLMEAFFRATSDAWHDSNRSGKEWAYVGYSPIVGVDADKIIQDFEDAHVLNIVRHPWPAYADTKKRAVPLSLAHYTTGWLVHQQHALAFSGRYPGRVHVLRYEDLIANPVAVLSLFLKKLGIGSSPTLARPSWNGKALEQVYPWGAIRTPTPEANKAAADELSAAEKEEIRAHAGPWLKAFGYE
ncbi:MAG: sulfotransferase [Planctomycetota bacterium]